MHVPMIIGEIKRYLRDDGILEGNAVVLRKTV